MYSAIISRKENELSTSVGKLKIQEENQVSLLPFLFLLFKQLVKEGGRELTLHKVLHSFCKVA